MNEPAIELDDPRWRPLIGCQIEILEITSFSLKAKLPDGRILVIKATGSAESGEWLEGEIWAPSRESTSGT